MSTYLNLLALANMLLLVTFALIMYVQGNKILEKALLSKSTESARNKESERREVTESQASTESREPPSKDVNVTTTQLSAESNSSLSSAISQASEEMEIREEDSEDSDAKKLIASLTADDMKVLKFLVDKGGEAYQVEIYKTLGMPKSTVAKIVRRLSERGYIVVERRGRYNYIKLVDREKIRKIVEEAAPLLTSSS